MGIYYRISASFVDNEISEPPIRSKLLSLSTPVLASVGFLPRTNGRTRTKTKKALGPALAVGGNGENLAAARGARSPGSPRTDGRTDGRTKSETFCRNDIRNYCLGGNPEAKEKLVARA